jgi:ATP-binding cassette subfamily B protein
MPNNKEYKVGDINKNGQGHRRGPGAGHGPGGGMSNPGEKADDFGTAIRRLASYCRKYYVAMLAALIFVAGGTVLKLIGPNMLSDITDKIIEGIMGGIDVPAIESIAMTLAIIYLVSYVLYLLQGLIMSTISQKITKSLRTEISEKINRLPLKYFDKTTTGDVLSRVTNDVDTIGQTLNQSLGNLFLSAASFVGALMMMFVTNWILAIAAILSTIIGFGFMMFIIRKSQKYFVEQQQELGKLNGHIEEIYAGHNVVKAYNGEKEASKTFNELNGKLYNAAWKSRFLSGLMMPLMTFVGNLGYVVVCVLGAVLASNGVITFGVIVAFMLYIRLFTEPLAQIAQAATNLQSTAAASERVFEFLDEEEMIEDHAHEMQASEVHGDVTFENVHFGYDEDKIIINDFSLEATKGQKIAIVGPTGAGKTTMVNLLMRFYELNSGKITIDGISSTDLSRQQIHDIFGMVLQDTWIFEGSIRDNIVYSKKDVTDEEVVAACKAVGIHHFIRTLQDGYDTVLNDSVNLSAGQKQLITIARAMIENAPMLILDEATSSVDTRTEVLIQQAMDKLMKGRTSFVIAHRLSTIKNADCILVMNEGDVIEKGTHDDLLAQDGFYANLYNSQFEQVS